MSQNNLPQPVKCAEKAKSVFTEETRHRSFKIVVGARTFFVNPSFLAERSSFFETLLFGDFKEKSEAKAVLKDVSEKDFDEFLWVLGAHPIEKKHVSASNFSTLAKLANMWDVSTLRLDCIDFIDRHYPFITPDVKTAVGIAAACELLCIPKASMKGVAAKLCAYGYDQLVAHNAQHLLKGETSAAVFLGSLKCIPGANHCKQQQSAHAATTPKECMFMGCEQEDELLYCTNCRVVFCNHHSKGDCRSNVNSVEKNNKVYYVDYVKLNEELFDTKEAEPEEKPVEESVSTTA